MRFVEEELSEQFVDVLDVPPDETRFGLYQGVSLTERSTAYSVLPDRIFIFRRPLLEEFDDLPDIRRELARPVIHEVASALRHQRRPARQTRLA